MHHVSIYLAGILLGLGLILPIGPINLFVIRQGINLGWRRAWPTVLAVTLNDTVMIALGAVVGAVAVSAFDVMHLPMMLAGAIYLTVLGVRYVDSTTSSLDPAEAPGSPLWQQMFLTVGLVWLNPHALLDIFGVLGTAIGTRDADVRLAFGLGVITASWLWYATLTFGAGLLRGRLTHRMSLRLEHFSGLLLLGFAGTFWLELVR
jgi:L-lysine exporter family protein LysE/ArgO